MQMRRLAEIIYGAVLMDQDDTLILTQMIKMEQGGPGSICIVDLLKWQHNGVGDVHGVSENESNAHVRWQAPRMSSTSSREYRP